MAGCYKITEADFFNLGDNTPLNIDDYWLNIAMAAEASAASGLPLTELTAAHKDKVLGYTGIWFDPTGDWPYGYLNDTYYDASTDTTSFVPRWVIGNVPAINVGFSGPGVGIDNYEFSDKTSPQGAIGMRGRNTVVMPNAMSGAVNALKGIPQSACLHKVMKGYANKGIAVVMADSSAQDTTNCMGITSLEQNSKTELVVRFECDFAVPPVVCVSTVKQNANTKVQFSAKDITTTQCKIVAYRTDNGQPVAVPVGASYSLVAIGPVA